jgi:hypothetical protein
MSVILRGVDKFVNNAGKELEVGAGSSGGTLQIIADETIPANSLVALKSNGHIEVVKSVSTTTEKVENNASGFSYEEENITNSEVKVVLDGSDNYFISYTIKGVTTNTGIVKKLTKSGRDYVASDEIIFSSDVVSTHSLGYDPINNKIVVTFVDSSENIISQEIVDDNGLSLGISGTSTYLYDTNFFFSNLSSVTINETGNIYSIGIVDATFLEVTSLFFIKTKYNSINDNYTVSANALLDANSNNIRPPLNSNLDLIYLNNTNKNLVFSCVVNNNLKLVVGRITDIDNLDVLWQPVADVAANTSKHSIIYNPDNGKIYIAYINSSGNASLKKATINSDDSITLSDEINISSNKTDVKINYSTVENKLVFILSDTVNNNVLYKFAIDNGTNVLFESERVIAGSDSNLSIPNITDPGITVSYADPTTEIQGGTSSSEVASQYITPRKYIEGDRSYSTTIIDSGSWKTASPSSPTGLSRHVLYIIKRENYNEYKLNTILGDLSEAAAGTQLEHIYYGPSDTGHYPTSGDYIKIAKNPEGATWTPSLLANQYGGRLLIQYKSASDEYYIAQTAYAINQSGYNFQQDLSNIGSTVGLENFKLWSDMTGREITDPWNTSINYIQAGGYPMSFRFVKVYENPPSSSSLTRGAARSTSWNNGSTETDYAKNAKDFPGWDFSNAGDGYYLRTVTIDSVGKRNASNDAVQLSTSSTLPSFTDPVPTRIDFNGSIEQSIQGVSSYAYELERKDAHHTNPITVALVKPDENHDGSNNIISLALKSGSSTVLELSNLHIGKKYKVKWHCYQGTLLTFNGVTAKVSDGITFTATEGTVELTLSESVSDNHQAVDIWLEKRIFTASSSAFDTYAVVRCFEVLFSKSGLTTSEITSGTDIPYINYNNIDYGWPTNFGNNFLYRTTPGAWGADSYSNYRVLELKTRNNGTPDNGEVPERIIKGLVDNGYLTANYKTFYTRSNVRDQTSSIVEYSNLSPGDILIGFSLVSGYVKELYHSKETVLIKYDGFNETDGYQISVMQTPAPESGLTTPGTFVSFGLRILKVDYTTTSTEINACDFLDTEYISQSSTNLNENELRSLIYNPNDDLVLATTENQIISFYPSVTTSTTNASQWFGIASENIVSGEEGEIKIFGGIASGLSLEAQSNYYVNYDGTLTTTEDTDATSGTHGLIGFSLNTTDLLITDWNSVYFGNQQTVNDAINNVIVNLPPSYDGTIELVAGEDLQSKDIVALDETTGSAVKVTGSLTNVPESVESKTIALAGQSVRAAFSAYDKTNKIIGSGFQELTSNKWYGFFAASAFDEATSTWTSDYIALASTEECQLNYTRYLPNINRFVVVSKIRGIENTSIWRLVAWLIEVTVTDGVPSITVIDDLEFENTWDPLNNVFTHDMEVDAVNDILFISLQNGKTTWVRSAKVSATALTANAFTVNINTTQSTGGGTVHVVPQLGYVFFSYSLTESYGWGAGEGLIRCAAIPYNTSTGLISNPGTHNIIDIGNYDQHSRWSNHIHILYKESTNQLITVQFDMEQGSEGEICIRSGFLTLNTSNHTVSLDSGTSVVGRPVNDTGDSGYRVNYNFTYAQVIFNSEENLQIVYSTDQGKFAAVQLNIDGSTLTYENWFLSSNETYGYWSNTSMYVDNYLWVFGKDSSSIGFFKYTNGYVVGNTNANKWIGIVDDDASQGASVSVKVAGGEKGSYTGLNIGANYFVNYDGTLVTVESLGTAANEYNDRTYGRIGRAISSEKLLLTDDYYFTEASSATAPTSSVTNIVNNYSVDTSGHVIQVVSNTVNDESADSTSTTFSEVLSKLGTTTYRQNIDITSGNKVLVQVTGHFETAESDMHLPYIGGMLQLRELTDGAILTQEDPGLWSLLMSSTNYELIYNQGFTFALTYLHTPSTTSPTYTLDYKLRSTLTDYIRLEQYTITLMEIES